MGATTADPLGNRGTLAATFTHDLPAALSGALGAWRRVLVPIYHGEQDVPTHPLASLPAQILDSRAQEPSKETSNGTATNRGGTNATATAGHSIGSTSAAR